MSAAKPIVPWLGGKRRLAQIILPRFPSHQCYVEPFAGGAALLFMRRRPAKSEVLNDINGELINLYRVVQAHPEELIRQFQWSLTSRQTFALLKVSDPGQLTDIQRAARFYYLQRLAFGGRVTGQTFGTSTTGAVRFNPLRIHDQLRAAHGRLSRVGIEQLPWQDCIRRYDRPHTLFYCDPPYWETAGYGPAFQFSEYQELARMMAALRGRAILSINDHPAIRDCFKGFYMEDLSIRYSPGGGAGKEARELLIFSYDPSL